MAGATTPSDVRRGRWRLVEAHLGLVDRIAQRVRADLEMPPAGRGGAGAASEASDELVAYGREALVEASRRFDPRSGVPFDRYARHRVRGAILDGVAEMGGVPRRLYRRLRFDRAASDVLAGWSAEDVAALASAGEVRDALHTAYLLASDGAGDWPGTGGSGGGDGPDGLDGLGLAVGGGAAGGPEAALGAQRMRGRLRDALAALPERERTLLHAHYYDGLSLAEAGRRVGLSRSYAARLQRRALALLRKRMGLPPPS